MAENANNPTATPPAATGGISKDEVTAIIAAALKPVTDSIVQIAKDQQILGKGFEEAVKAATTAAPKPGDKVNDQVKPLTAEDANKLFGEMLDKKLGEFRQGQQQSADRHAFMSKHLDKLPAVYRDKLGNDPAKWEEETKAIRSQYESDLKSQGFKPVDVGTDQPAGKPASALPVDLTKMTAAQQREASLKALPPIGGVSPAATNVQAAPSPTTAA
ncbi:MAG: hypothetical protein ACTHLZ_18690 [Tepidisphaeraceae bacterium]